MTLGPMSSTAETDHLQRSKRRRNTTRACDRCHQNACKCTPGIEGVTCARCEDQGMVCTYNRPVKRRGPPARRLRRNSQPPADIDRMTADPPALTQTGPSITLGSSEMNEEANQVSSRPLPLYSPALEDAVSPEVIKALAEVFYYSIYPIRPYFHWPTFESQIHQQLYRSDWGVFIVTMAVCALTAGRLYKGAAILPDVSPGRSKAVTISSKCYDAAVKATPSDITCVPDYYQAMKAAAMLTSVCVENGNIRRAVAHLGDYSTLSVMNSFHIEDDWPANLTEVQRQERRRLFWSVYQQDQYISTNFGMLSRQREAQSKVSYPAEVFDDKDITAFGIHMRPDRTSFVRGLNFCSDVYRLSENLDSMIRTGYHVSPDEPGGAVTSLLIRARTSEHFASDSLHLISKLHKELPQELKIIKDVTGDLQTDRYRFVAINILLTTQNIKMRLVGSEKRSIHLRCAIASELLDELGTVPPRFFQTSSTGSLYHLAHIGDMLGSVIESHTSAWTYLQVRNILLVLADFLEKIESNRVSPANLAAKLRAQLSRIDQCMHQTTQQDPESGVQSMGQSLLLESPRLNGTAPQQQDSPSHSINDTRTGVLVSPNTSSISNLARLLGISEPVSSHPVQQQRVSAPINALPDIQDTGFSNAFDISQPPDSQNPGSDFIFPPDQNGLAPTDFFDGWPILSGQTNTFSTFGAVSPPPDHGLNGLVMGNDGER